MSDHETLPNTALVLTDVFLCPVFMCPNTRLPCFSLRITCLYSTCNVSLFHCVGHTAGWGNRELTVIMAPCSTVLYTVAHSGIGLLNTFHLSYLSMCKLFQDDLKLCKRLKFRCVFCLFVCLVLVISMLRENFGGRLPVF